jgi:hypothetical protein
MPTHFEAFLWGTFVLIGLGGIGLSVVVVWGLLRIVGVARPELEPIDDLERIARGGLARAAFNDPAAVLFIASIVLLLLPLLALALWSFSLEARSGKVGAGLPFVLVHLLLLWQLLLLGTKVQRRVELSATGIEMFPILAMRRHVPWTSIARVEDVHYVGPGISGLYLYDESGSRIGVLDSWMPGSSRIRTLIRRSTRGAIWTTRTRGFVVG